MAVTEHAWKPVEVSDAELAFGARVTHLMPPYADIPEEFKRGPRGRWNQVVSDWFFWGLENAEWTVKEGIDPATALRHLSTVMGSFEPKHEHKTAACAYLMSLWFEDVTYTRGEGR